MSCVRFILATLLTLSIVSAAAQRQATASQTFVTTQASQERSELQAETERQHAWYDSGSRQWSTLYHGTLILSAGFSLLAAIIIKREGASKRQKNLAATLALAATALTGIAGTDAMGSQRKWRANRASRAAIEQLRIDFTNPKIDLDSMRTRLKGIIATHNAMISGQTGVGTPLTRQ